MEPVVLGAGGMILVDPLFQRTLVNAVRSSASLFTTAYDILSPTPGSQAWTGLPVVADEVFTGLYRLGHKTACSLLGIDPDISVHAKLLTGGLVPLSATLASESIFEAFLADNKADALLHGHSYTAHPVGCAVANESLKQLRQLDADGAWDTFKDDWHGTKIGASMAEKVQDVASTLALGGDILPDGRRSRHARPMSPKVWSVWSLEFVTALSNLADRVDGVWALGSVLAIKLEDGAGGGGYTSNAARGLQRQLLDGTGTGWNMHARVLGNVLYLMASQTSSVEHVRLWEEMVLKALV